MRINLTSIKALLRPRIPAWTDRLGMGRIALGYDQATTEGEKSNPASITVMERNGALFSQRLVMRFKAADYQARLALLEIIIDDLEAARHRAVGLVIDATSEKGGAQQARDQFAGRVPVDFYEAARNVEERGQKYPMKTLLSDRYRQTFEDNCMSMPPDAWLLSDHALVKRAAGRYIVEEDSSGNHGDAWQSGMFALWRLLSRSERQEMFTVDVRGGAGQLARNNRPGLHPVFQRQPGRSGQLLS